MCFTFKTLAVYIHPSIFNTFFFKLSGLQKPTGADPPQWQGHLLDKPPARCSTTLYIISFGNHSKARKKHITFYCTVSRNFQEYIYRQNVFSVWKSLIKPDFTHGALTQLLALLRVQGGWKHHIPLYKNHFVTQTTQNKLQKACEIGFKTLCLSFLPSSPCQDLQICKYWWLTLSKQEHESEAICAP